MISSHGQCHCGNISLDIQYPETIHSFTAGVCRCQFCRMHGAMWLGLPISQLQVQAELASQAHFYDDDLLGVRYLLCRHCGVLTSVFSEIENQTYAMVNAGVVNLPTHIKTDVFQYGPYPNLAGRLQIRKESWLSTVKFSRELDRLLKREEQMAQAQQDG
ncbi:hypothetical protein EV696_109117 [Permianibacter aggregans]|uniref:CENP-V/GFA domain-containing protein n=2 Tax=Permianibacter aggregans TaxID=1510150 RepID=A0A4R6UQC8_9GAMM|nr:hypothetical protein EV696_109117 [Permianibacter aggregans]